MTHAPPVPPSAPSPSTRNPASPWTHKALWLIALGLLANAGVSLYSRLTGHDPDLVLSNSAYAQNVPVLPAAPQLLGAGGLYMMPAQLGPTTFGVYLMDVDSQTITVYRAMPDNPTGERFHLMAARSFKNDRFLTDFNNNNPTPGQVEVLVQKQRQRQEIKQKADEPTVDQTPPKDENKPDPAKIPEAPAPP